MNEWPTLDFIVEIEYFIKECNLLELREIDKLVNKRWIKEIRKVKKNE